MDFLSSHVHPTFIAIPPIAKSLAFPPISNYSNDEKVIHDKVLSKLENHIEIRDRGRATGLETSYATRW